MHISNYGSYTRLANCTLKKSFQKLLLLIKIVIILYTQENTTVVPPLGMCYFFYIHWYNAVLHKGHPTVSYPLEFDPYVTNFHTK